MIKTNALSIGNQRVSAKIRMQVPSVYDRYSYATKRLSCLTAVYDHQKIYATRDQISRLVRLRRETIENKDKKNQKARKQKCKMKYKRN